MSAPVDVLAVLDDTAAMLRAIAPAVCDRLSGLHRDAQQITCARAAVAELIEKSAAALHYMRLHKYADQAWADDLAEALARVRGGRADD